MTSPVIHDYPDWGRQAASADIVVAQHLNENMAGPVTDNVKFVGQYDYVHVRAFSVATSVSVELVWYLDQGATVLVGQDNAQTFGAVDVVSTHPVRAPFLKVVTKLAAYPNVATNLVTMTSVPSSPQSGVAGDNTLISQLNGGPLGAGANVTLTAKGTRAGEAYFEADLLGAADFTIYLFATDYLGNNIALASVYGAGGVFTNKVGKTVYLPAQTCRVQVFNQTAAAHDYRVLLHHKNFPI